MAELKNGYSFKSDEYDSDSSGKYKIITIKNVTHGNFVDTSNCNTISELPSNIREHQILKDGDILVSMTGATLGRVAMNKSDNVLLNQRVGLVQLNGTNIDREYIFQILRSKDFENTMINIGSGAAQPNISKQDIEDYEFLLPDDIETQKRVATTLSNYDQIIDLQNELVSIIQRERVYAPSSSDNHRNTEWETVKLGDICEIKTGKLNANAAVENGEYPFFTCAEEVSRIDSYSFDTEALLISGNGSKLGHIHHYKGKFDAYQRTYVLDKFKADIKYIYYALKAYLPERIEQEKNGGAVPYIKLNCLTDMEINIPKDVKEQERIASILKSYDQMIDSQEKLISIIERERESLQRKLLQ